MIFRQKDTPIESKGAMGYRGKKNERTCYICGRPEERNFDEYGRLQMLSIKSIDKNLSNAKWYNHFFLCEQCKLSDA